MAYPSAKTSQMGRKRKVPKNALRPNHVDRLDSSAEDIKLHILYRANFWIKTTVRIVSHPGL
jgi:hypothetical protein